MLRGKIEISHQMEAIVIVEHLFNRGECVVSLRLFFGPLLDLLSELDDLRLIHTSLVDVMLPCRVTATWIKVF